MLCGNLKKKILGAILCATVLLMIIPPVFADELHEDPETAHPAFSGISLLRYYSGSLDFVIQKNPIEVEARLGKMPFANIPQGLEVSAAEFVASSISISHLVVGITDNLDRLVTLRGQFRFDEAIKLAAQISDNLSQANSELGHIEQAAKTTGAELKVLSTPDGSDLRRAYDEGLERIDRIRQMLTLYKELLKSTGLTIYELLKSTGLTMDIQPTTAFVGDNIRFEGVLNSVGQPLGGREVDILLGGSMYVTVITDANGFYQGTLTVPYQYVPELDVQALYYPRKKDIGLYLASLSPVIKLKVLFYKAELKVTLKDKAYPGLDTKVTGRFDYGQSPALKERSIEFYLDDVFITRFAAQETFDKDITISPELDTGKHVITVSSAAAGRYASVVASAVLNVTRATPVLDLSMPKVALIPWSVSLKGRLYSEVGPLSEASVKIGLGKSQTEMVTSQDGTFDTKIKTGMGFGLIGSQDMTIQAMPKEPWHTSLITTRPVLVVNVVNFSGILAILVILAIYLPARLRRRFGAFPRKIPRPMIVADLPEPTPTYSKQVTAVTLTEGSQETSLEPRDKILNWYRLAVRLLRKLTQVFLVPQQTLREFARENSGRFGPAAKYFMQLTGVVERLLYSQHKATDQDVETSKELSHTIEKEIKGEGI